MTLIELFFQNSYWCTALFFMLGAILGSFANVVIYRWPQEMSVVTPRSHCYQCKKTIAWFDNVPVLSWLILGGRCRYCSARFSVRYALVELLVGVTFAALYLHVGLEWVLLEYFLFSWALITACFIDLDHMLLPDVLTLSGIVIGFVGAVLNPERSWLDSFYGILMGGGFLWAIAYLYFVLRQEEGMGGGDIKLLAWIGAVLGWKSIPFVILGSSLAGSFVGILIGIKMKSGSLSSQTRIPIGPLAGF